MNCNRFYTLFLINKLSREAWQRFIVLLSHFWNKKGRLKLNLIKLEITLVKKICKRGVPEAETVVQEKIRAICRKSEALQMERKYIERDISHGGGCINCQQ